MDKIITSISTKFLLIIGMIGIVVSKVFAQSQNNNIDVYGVPPFTQTIASSSTETWFTIKNILLFIAAPVVILAIIMMGIRVIIKRKRSQSKKEII